MEQKRPKGIIVVGILKILYTTVIFLFLVGGGLGGVVVYLGEFAGAIFVYGFTLLYIFTAVAILLLKEFARKISICLDLFFLLYLVIVTAPSYIKYPAAMTRHMFTKAGLILLIVKYLIPIMFIYFLTRPKVKEQFK